MYPSGAPCDAHSFATSVGQCGDCERPVCGGCEAFVGTARRCADCARRYDRRKRARERAGETVLLMAALIASLALGGVLGMAGTRSEPPRPALFSIAY